MTGKEVACEICGAPADLRIESHVKLLTPKAEKLVGTQVLESVVLLCVECCEKGTRAMVSGAQSRGPVLQ